MIIENILFEKIVPGGQAIGLCNDGKKIFAWGALPGERANVLVTKKKKNYLEGVCTKIIKHSKNRISPIDTDSFLSTSPWQIFDYNFELNIKCELIKEAFRQEKIDIKDVNIVTDGKIYNYRNKIEFSFFFDKETKKLRLAFFRRGSKGKIPVNGTSLAKDEINLKANQILDALNTMCVCGYDLKTLILRCNTKGQVNWQLYVKKEDFDAKELIDKINDDNGEVIFSDPKSPASVITKYLSKKTNKLNDYLLGVNFTYPTESFFQINLPVYEFALKDIKNSIDSNLPLLDLYSGVGTIGLSTVHKNQNITLVEINKNAVEEMRENIKNNNYTNAHAVLSSSENAISFIENAPQIILDPPRAGLHEKIINKLIETKPENIIYMSCNPTTQARDIKNLSTEYKIVSIKAYNFFPRTPHVETIALLSRLSK